MRYLAGLLLLLIFHPVNSSTQLPIENFIKHGDYLDISLSPDGKHLAARTRIDGKVVAIFINRESGSVVGGVRPRSKSEIYSVDWLTNKRVVFKYAEKEHYLDTPIAKGELFAMNIDGGRVEPLAGFRSGDERLGTRISSREDTYATFELLNSLPNDEKYALIIEYPWSQIGKYWYDNRKKAPVVSKINIHSGKKKKIESLPFRDPSVLTTTEGELLFATWHDEAGDLRIAYRPSSDAQWNDLADSVKLNDDMSAVALNHAADTVFLRGPYGAKGFRTIYQLSLTDFSLKPMFTDLDSDIRDWVIDPDTGDVIIGVSFHDNARYHYAENVTSSVYTAHQKLARAFKGQNIHIASSTEDGSHLLVRVTADVNPGEYYYVDAQSNAANFVFANLSWIDPRQMRPMINDTALSADGVDIPIKITLPLQAEEPSDFPLIVLIHGGPHGVADLWGFDRESQLLANQGYAVLQVNYRGSGNYGLDYQRSGYRQWGGLIIDDIASATDYVIENYPVKKNSVCAYGASFGGYAAIMLAARYPSKLECAVGYVGVYDLSLMYKEGDIPKRWGGINFLKQVLGEDKQQLNAFSPINLVDSIEAKVMLIHGREDIRAPIEHAKAMRKALESAGKDPEWLVYKRSGHGVWDLESQKEMYTKLLAFLERNTSN